MISKYGHEAVDALFEATQVRGCSTGEVEAAAEGREDSGASLMLACSCVLVGVGAMEGLRWR